ncbi:DUF4876 domain-containing protein [Sphingobacterium corticis]|uniref:DUF4876 domain-containing protein n=1 Tax=Sphingobacterium corticis TaxID=1812823 RepID=A0ABW5NMD4_9SPHI
MKMKPSLLFIASALFLFTIACQKDREQAMPVNMQIQLGVDEAEVPFQVPYEKAKIVLESSAGGMKYEIQADSEGKITLRDLVPGVYSINVTLQIPAADYSTLSGSNQEDDFFLNFSLPNKGIYADEILNATLIPASTVGGFVIKQIYYLGSDIKKGANFRDNFIEIYNNSSQRLYADSLLIITVFGNQGKVSNDWTLPGTTQYDWSKSINMDLSKGDPNTEFIYAKALFEIPSDATGKRYPVDPGESIIIAATAANHAGSYVDVNGKTITVENPELTVDLRDADFEVNTADYNKRIGDTRAPMASDIDNLDVDNVYIHFMSNSKEWLLDPKARESYAIAKVDRTVDVSKLPTYSKPEDRNVTSSTTLYPQFPIKYIIDAVEIKTMVTKEITARRLPIRLDAGATYGPGEQYSSQSVVRRTAKSVNGRRILKDTNNSNNDFGYLQRADATKGQTSFID